MTHSHTPASRASTTTSVPHDAHLLDAEARAAEPADPATRPSEGPASVGASEGPPSDRSPASPAPVEPPGSSPSAGSFHPLRWDDRKDARVWLDRVRTRVDDLAAVAREGARQSKHRVLSRSERSRQASTALRRLRTLFEAAEAGLDSLSSTSGDPGE